MFTKNSLKVLANSLSLLMVFPFSSIVMYSDDFILLEKRDFTVTLYRGFTEALPYRSPMSFRSKFS